MRRFELSEGTSNKFWEIEVAGAALTVRFGKIGTNGQTQEKDLGTATKAESERDKLIREKTKKGYSEIASAKPDDNTAAVPVPAEAPEVATKAKGRAKADEISTDPGWLDAGNGYALALEAGKIVCRNAKGQRLASVPKDVKEGEVGEQLERLRAFLAAHEKSCAEAVETWMLRSLPIPREVLAEAWDDESWRRALENAIVVPIDPGGRLDPSQMGFFRGVDATRGLGIVNRDGETAWLDAASVALPHPVLLPDLDDLRALATELGLTQGLSQLFRETFQKPASLDTASTSVSEFRGGVFKQLNHALGQCRKLGYRVRGGSATTKVWEASGDTLEVQEARFWVGADDPSFETQTEDLGWVDERERALPLTSVGRVAWSEGMRMASGVYAARVVEKEAASV